MKIKQTNAFLLAILILGNLFFMEKYFFYKKMHRMSQDSLQGISRQYSRMILQVRYLQKREERSRFCEFVEFANRYKSPIFYRILSSVFRLSQKYNLDPYLVLSLIYHESGFNPQAVSIKGAYGLMQINFVVWKDQLQLQIEKILDIEYNIENGCRILQHYLTEAGGDMVRALYLYNNGYMESGNARYPNLILQGKFSPQMTPSAG